MMWGFGRLVAETEKRSAMKRFWLCVGVMCGVAAGQASRVKVVEHPQTVDVMVDGKLFTTYHFADDFFYEPVRPFLWPVNASDGVGVTTDQQQTDPKHGYQRSIWVGHGDVNGADHWKFKAKPQPKQRHVKFDWVKGDGFQEELVWEDKDAKPMLKETRTLKFDAYKDGVRGIEFTLALTPVAGDVVFGIHGDRGLLSVRELESLYHQPTFTSAEGGACAAPKAEKKGEDEGVAGVHTAWCDESGDVKGQVYGVAIFDAPGNVRHAPMWHATPDARLATDMFEVDKAVKGEMRQGPLTIAAGTTLTLRYEVVVHKGPASEAGLTAKYAEFAGEEK
jgi:hypothetical protein